MRDGRTVVTRAPRIAQRIVAGEALVITLVDRKLHALDPVATVIWRAIDGIATFDTIATRLACEFDVSREQALRDVEDFVTRLARVGAVTLRDDPAHSSSPATDSSQAAAASPAPERRRTYSRPTFASESAFEAHAGCGKADPSQFTCFRIQRFS